MPPPCEFCGGAVNYVAFDYGVDPDTGYHDMGEVSLCSECGFTEEITDATY